MKKIILTTFLVASLNAANAINCEICNDIMVNGQPLTWWVGGLTGEIQVESTSGTSSSGTQYTTHNMTDNGEYHNDDVNLFWYAAVAFNQCAIEHEQQTGEAIEPYSIGNILSCDISQLEASVNHPLSLRIIFLNLVSALSGSDMDDFVSYDVMMTDVLGCLLNSVPGPGSICNETDGGGNVVEPGPQIIDAVLDGGSVQRDRFKRGKVSRGAKISVRR